jgi:hypothetical protein
VSIGEAIIKNDSKKSAPLTQLNKAFQLVFERGFLKIKKIYQKNALTHEKPVVQTWATGF